MRWLQRLRRDTSQLSLRQKAKAFRRAKREYLLARVQIEDSVLSEMEKEQAMLAAEVKYRKATHELIAS